MPKNQVQVVIKQVEVEHMSIVEKKVWQLSKQPMYFCSEKLVKNTYQLKKFQVQAFEVESMNIVEKKRVQLSKLPNFCNEELVTYSMQANDKVLVQA